MRRVWRYLLPVALIILALALLASLAANLILLRQMRQFYDEVNATRLDPYGLFAYGGDVVPPPSPDAQRVVFFGDSRALAWRMPELEGFEFINRGVGAQTTEQVLGRLAQDLPPLAPDIVVIQVGINDLKAIPLFPQDADAIIARCKTNIQAIVDAVQALGADVILTTIFPAGHVPLERRMFWSDAVPPAVREVNDELRAMAEPRIRVLDAHAALADESGVLPSEFAEDFMHLSDAGYTVLNQMLTDMLTDGE